MTTPASRPAPSELGDLLMFAARRLRQARMESLSPHGLSPHQGRAFYVIARHARAHPEQGPLRPSDLARRLRITPRSATEVVDALCDLGLVQRRPSATDRRATSLLLTGAGEALAAQIQAQPDAGGEVFAALSGPEREKLTVLLRKITGADGGEGHRGPGHGHNSPGPRIRG